MTSTSLNSSFKIGDIFYSSWGYDQTNTNFYQITEKIGSTMLELREIDSQYINFNHVIPLPNHFKEGNNYPVLRRKVLKQKQVRISSHYAYLNNQDSHYSSH